MKKQLATVLAATAVLGVTTAFAANPFADVTADHWAYQSVSQLAAAGVINGYPDGTFKGQNSITRYEMAQMVAKAMANQNRANAEQQAMINRLADEFSAELNNLGVRVGNLEKKVGNVKVTGDARLRYQGGEGDTNGTFDYRGRVQFNGAVTDNTTATVRVTTGAREFGDASSDTKVTFDRMNLNHRFGENTDLTVGRYGEFVGSGLFLDSTFDGAKANYDNGKIAASASYGSAILDSNPVGTDENPTMTILQMKGKLGDKSTLGGFYALGNKDMPSDVYGFNADTKLGDKVWVGGEWIKATEGTDNQAWVAGVGYGDYDQSKKGTWDVKAQYFNAEENSPIIESTWNQGDIKDYKGWLATVDYALAKNVGLSAYYGFGGESQSGVEKDDFYRAELNYKF